MTLPVKQLVYSVLIYSTVATSVVILIFLGNGNTKLNAKNATVNKRAKSNFEVKSNSKDNNVLVNFTKNTATQEKYSRKDSKDQIAKPKLKRKSKESYIMKAREAGQPIIETIMKKTSGCPEYSPMIRGKLKVDSKFVPTEEQAIKAAGFQVANGCFQPTYCKPGQTVAVIVPYKNRDEHLRTLMYHLHPILQRQWIRYCIFVPEQYDDGAFNKARVMNAGFLEIMKDKRYKFDCLIFHDVDMLLEDDRNTYSCADTPKHLSPALDKFDYKVNYGTHFGGVGAVSVKHYKLVNGHSNRFYGWGGEDSDIENRYKLHGLNTVWDENYGRYKMIPHKHPWYFNPLSGVGSFKKIKDTKRFDDKSIMLPESDPSGLSSIKYSVKQVQRHKLYTKITLDVRTFLIDRATFSFDNSDDYVDVENPWFTNKRLASHKDEQGSVRGFGVAGIPGRFPNYDCEYRRFKHKTVNMTLGYNANDTYNVTYNDLEAAKNKCSLLLSYCGSIVEILPNQYVLRATAFMHETTLKYKLGRYPQILFTERHPELSVYAKICPEDARYLQFINKPVILEGNASEGPEPTHTVDFDILVYAVENVSLNYSITLYSAHKAIRKEMEAVMNTSLEIYDSLSVTYTDSIHVLNMVDPITYKRFLPENIESLEQLAKSKDPVLRVQTPPMKTPRIPGCYVCESAITDQSGSPLFKWKWWFEIRAETTRVDKEILDQQLISGQVGTTEYSDGIRSKRIKLALKKFDTSIIDNLSELLQLLGTEDRMKIQALLPDSPKEKLPDTK